MIALLIKSYLTLLISIGSLALLFFMAGLVGICKIFSAPNALSQQEKHKPSLDADFTAISGDDIVATQLDLARAYLETGQSQLAKEILQTVVHHGNNTQKAEANHLLTTLLQPG